MTDVYQASTIKRRRQVKRRTKAQVEQLEEQIYEALRDDHPQSIRHVFYKMTNPRLPEPVEKTDWGYAQLQARITEMRRRGDLPYSWLSDASRRGYHTPVYGSGAEFVRAMSGGYRADLWRDADYYCEVWVESRSLAGVIERDCREMAVSLYPCGGFSSITFAYEAAEHMNEVVQGRSAIVFYIGDYDPAGVLIDVALERELREHLDPDIDLSFRRIGITPHQIQKYDLPTKPRKARDKRAQHVITTVEAEAMPASIMRRILRRRVEELMPFNALQNAKVAEQSEREGLERMAAILEGRA
jgi:hypothetical protein